MCDHMKFHDCSANFISIEDPRAAEAVRLALISIQQTALLTFTNTNPNPNHSPNPSPVSVQKHRGQFAGWKLV